LRYVKSYVDIIGKSRHYFRKRGMKTVPLPGLIGSSEFMAVYSAALAGVPAVVGECRTKVNSISAMIVGYLGSAAYAKLAPVSKQQYRERFERMRKSIGHLSITSLKRKHIAELIDAMGNTPHAARDYLMALRLLIKYAMNISVLEQDPSIGLRVEVPKSAGYHTWNAEEIAAFEQFYPVGTRPRLALELLLNTAGRCGDVVRLGRANIRNGMINFSTQKTKIALSIPVTSELQAAIDAAPAGVVTMERERPFLLTERGKAFTAARFSKWFRQQCLAAGLKAGCSAHGLRKAACVRLAEAGATAPQIAAVSGHASLKLVQRYIEAANKGKLAVAAMNKVRTLSSV
jgi:integrase